MSELISGKDALIALGNGEEVQCANADLLNWNNVSGDCHLDLFTTAKNRNGYSFIFRLKPRTITLNNIEVPAPFEPKKDCLVYILDDSRQEGFREYDYDIEDIGALFFGVWRAKDEIKQVVSALRIAFKPQ